MGLRFKSYPSQVDLWEVSVLCPQDSGPQEVGGGGGLLVKRGRKMPPITSETRTGVGDRGWGASKLLFSSLPSASELRMPLQGSLRAELEGRTRFKEP